MTTYSKLEKSDTAIEVLSALRGYKVVSLMKETRKPLNEQNPVLIEKLRKDLLDLGHDRFLMYKGNKEVIDKILTVYSKIVMQNMSNRNVSNGR